LVNPNTHSKRYLNIGVTYSGNQAKGPW